MAGTHARSAQLSTGALIVGDDAELLGQLHAYLTRAGVEARATRRLDDASEGQRREHRALSG